MEHPDYPGYLIYNDGRIWSEKKRKTYVKPFLHNGYHIICVYIDGKKVNKKTHRLVAETYIPNPNNLPQVNHINLIRTDNRVENLEWCSNLYNCQSIRTSKPFGSVYLDNDGYRFVLQENSTAYRMRFKTKEEAEIYREVTKLFYEDLVLN